MKLIKSIKRIGIILICVSFIMVIAELILFVLSNVGVDVDVFASDFTRR